MTIEGMPETPAEKALADHWSNHLTSHTLAVGDRLFEYICRFKIVNNVPFLPAEREYLDRCIASKRKAPM